jgi:SNF2 family DNA or RNA helicase
VFSSQFNAPLFELERRIADQFKVKCETITGENSSQIDPIEERFKTGETRILCINMKTGGEGLNLQAASHAIFLDLWWNPESNRQAEARLYRQGQKNTVVIHILQAEESVDQYIQSILDKKNEMITGVMEDSTFRKESGWRDYLTDLI